MANGFQVFEIGPTGGCHSISKVYPTYLGGLRALNRIKREDIFYGVYKYVLREV